jgi:hypothetical protein
MVRHTRICHSPRYARRRDSTTWGRALRIMTARPLIIFATIALSGCVALPIPTSTQVTPRVHGTVINAKNGNPIMGANVTCERSGFYGFSTTSDNGTFAIAPIYQRHFLLLLGGPLPVRYPWAWTHGKGNWCFHPMPLYVTASALGYVPSTFHYTFRDYEKLSKPVRSAYYEKLRNNGVKIDLKMHPTP